MLIEKFFDKETMSVHLKENYFPLAKKGVPGSWNLVKLKEEIISKEEIKKIAQELIEMGEQGEKSFIEVKREGSLILQIKEYRVIITQPPFSDGWELTIVKPIKKLSFDYYKLNQKLKERITQQAEGILISGSPGEGKTTFARSLAEYCCKLNKIVKTIESPRDMLLDEKITQYSLNRGEKDEIYDVLLLSRPDYTFFDEMRTTADFRLFSQLRLAGIGIIGVVHATSPIDTIQRFIGKIEMGMIPQIIDTVIFIKAGKIEQVLNLEMKMKVPTGMEDIDLTRPVIEVNECLSKELKYEIYTYGEQTIIFPIKRKEIKIDRIENKIKEYTNNFELEIVSDNKIIIYVCPQDFPKLIGTQGKEISKIEKELNLKIDIRKLKEQKKAKEVKFEVELKKNIIFSLGENFVDQAVDLYSGENFLVSTKTSKKGVIKINPFSDIGKRIVDALKTGKIRLLVL